MKWMVTSFAIPTLVFLALWAFPAFPATACSDVLAIVGLLSNPTGELPQVLSAQGVRSLIHSLEAYDDLLSQELVAKLRIAPVSETVVTENGSIFTTVYERELNSMGVTNPTEFGIPAHRDARGVVWGELARNHDGTPRLMNLEEAIKYCKDLGARLPTGYFRALQGDLGFPDQVSDFESLRQYMGARSATSSRPDGHYRPQIFSGSSESRFWSSSAFPLDKSQFYFDSRTGQINTIEKKFIEELHWSEPQHWRQRYSVRCVAP